ncbi:MAG: hypothetical protein VKJ06_05300 [Vampirovibrionales bacterium]|nr:hypothetical protein [Vampirovibrionales bacterium]
MDERISKEVKLAAAKDIVASYVKNHNQPLTPTDVCSLLKQVYQTIDDMLPVEDKRRVGLGI